MRVIHRITRQKGTVELEELTGHYVIKLDEVIHGKRIWHKSDCVRLVPKRKEKPLYPAIKSMTLREWLDSKTNTDSIRIFMTNKCTFLYHVNSNEYYLLEEIK